MQIISRQLMSLGAIGGVIEQFVRREIDMISEAKNLLSVYHQNEDLINVGAYVKNSKI